MALNNPAYRPDKRLKRQLFNKVDRLEWLNLNINVDAFCDHWELLSPEFSEIIDQFRELYVEQICKTFKLKKEHVDQTWKECLLNNQKVSIEVYCIWKFASADPLCFSRAFGIKQLRSRQSNMPAIVVKLAEEKSKTDLNAAFIHLQIKKAGHARFQYGFSRDKPIDLQRTQLIMHSLSSDLKKKEGKKYYVRFYDIIGDSYYCLLLKETSDRVYPAIPDNLRVVSGKYLLVSVNKKTYTLEVHTQVYREAWRIRNYVARRTGTKLNMTRKTAEHDPEAFFQLLLENEDNDGISLLEADFYKNNIGDAVWSFRDKQKKNNIVSILEKQKRDGNLELKSFSEVKSMIFGFADIRYQIQVYEDRWSQIRLDVQDRGKPALELATFKQTFETAFGIPLQTSLKNQNKTLNNRDIIQNLLDKPTLEAVLPTEVDALLMKLITSKIVSQPETSVKRRCANCFRLYWKEGKCPTCGSNEFFFEGEYKDIEVNSIAVLDVMSKALKKDNKLDVKKVKHQIDSSSFWFLEIMNEQGKPLSIYVSKSNVPQKVLSHYARTGNALLIVIIKSAQPLRQQVVNWDFECIDFATCFAEIESGEILATIRAAIQSQHNKWKVKIAGKGWRSYLDYKSRNDAQYSDQQFEVDIFNMLHEVFLIGDRLGGNFAGVPAPDGIISIQDYGNPLSRYCLAWDCKHSKTKKGYQLGDPPAKHRRYIHTLKNNDKVLFYGGLKTYLIISQNMDMGSYENFYTRMMNKFKWTGQIVFIHSDLILRLYEVYRDNQALIASYPQVFYSELFQLFKKTDRGDSRPFKELTNIKVEAILTQVATTFNKKKKKFQFTRNEFN